MRTLFTLLMMLLFPVLALAQEPKALARTSLKPQAEIWMGQEVVMVVELLVPGYFAGAASFDLPRVPGVIIVPPVGSPLVSNEEMDGVSYTIQRHELMLYSQVEGMATVPACEVRLQFKRSPLDHDAVEQAVTTQAVSFKAMRPPGTQPGQTIITSVDLKVEETWKPEPGANAKVGDALVRTLRWSASDLTGMAFPPFKPAPIRGLGIYPGEPVVEDTEDRGTLSGGRTDTVTYVCKTGGHFEIPPLSVTWWNPEAKELKKIAFKAHAFEVPMPPPPPVTPRAWLKREWREHGALATALAVASLLSGVTVHLFKDALARFLKRLRPRHLPPLNP